jgi:hypothetical protein
MSFKVRKKLIKKTPPRKPPKKMKKGDHEYTDENGVVHRSKYDAEMGVKRDARGRWLNPGGRRTGGVDPQVYATRSVMRANMSTVHQEILRIITSRKSDPKLKAQALKLYCDYAMPRPGGNTVADLDTNGVEKLVEIGKLPVENQPLALVRLYYDAYISKDVMEAASRTLGISQHMRDEAMEQLLLSKAADDAKSDSDDD